MLNAIIIAESQRRKQEPIEPIAAIDRYIGVYFRIVKKYLREKKLTNTDILIISHKFGILQSHDRVEYHKSTDNLNFESVENARKNNLKLLKTIFEKKKYDEIYVNVGVKFAKLIDGFEDLTNAKVIYASGSGLGPKAKHMKNYILSIS